MAISKENMQKIQRGFAEIFGDKGTNKTKGPDNDGRFTEVSCHVKEPLNEHHLRKLQEHKQYNGIPHAYELKRSGAGITILYQ